MTIVLNNRSGDFQRIELDQCERYRFGFSGEEIVRDGSRWFYLTWKGPNASITETSPENVLAFCWTFRVPIPESLVLSDETLAAIEKLTTTAPPRLSAPADLPGLENLPAVFSTQWIWLDEVISRNSEASKTNLGNKRTKGQKSHKGNRGIDTDDRIWIKLGRRSFLYLEATAVPA
jgi:hypothetical protein